MNKIELSYTIAKDIAVAIVEQGGKGMLHLDIGDAKKAAAFIKDCAAEISEAMPTS